MTRFLCEHIGTELKVSVQNYRCCERKNDVLPTLPTPLLTKLPPVLAMRILLDKRRCEILVKFTISRKTRARFVDTNSTFVVIVAVAKIKQ